MWRRTKGRRNRQPQSTRNATHVVTGSNRKVRDKAQQQLRPNNPESRRNTLKLYEKIKTPIIIKSKERGATLTYPKDRREQTHRNDGNKIEYSQDPTSRL